MYPRLSVLRDYTTCYLPCEQEDKHEQAEQRRRVERVVCHPPEEDNFKLSLNLCHLAGESGVQEERKYLHKAAQQHGVRNAPDKQTVGERSH